MTVIAWDGKHLIANKLKAIEIQKVNDKYDKHLPPTSC